MVFETRTIIIAPICITISTLYKTSQMPGDCTCAWQDGVACISCTVTGQAALIPPRADFAFLFSMLLFMLPVNIKSMKINSDIKVVREMFP